MAYLITFIIYFNRIVSHKDWVLNNLPIKKKKKGRERLQMCVNSEFSNAASVNIKHWSVQRGRELIGHGQLLKMVRYDA